MLIEFAGCSCAGKSTLKNQLLKLAQIHVHRASCAPTFTGFSAVWLIPAMAKALWHHNALSTFAFRQIDYRVRNPLVRFRLKWNVLKILACFDIAKGLESKGGMTLLDEGPINLVQTVFCVGNQPIENSDVGKFLELCPKSTALVLVHADRCVLHERSTRRDKPTLPNSTKQQNEEFAERAYTLFSSPELLKILKANVAVHSVDTTSVDANLASHLLSQLTLKAEDASAHV